jgi:tetratricopeptide (TPR) repeat protein
MTQTRISSIVILIALLVTVPAVAVQDSSVERYAVIMVGSDDTNSVLHQRLDPIDVNGAEIALARVYGALKTVSFKDENIRVLYVGGGDKLDWSESSNQNWFAEMKKHHFSGKYPNSARKNNVSSCINAFKAKADANDIFVFYLVTHGAPNGTVQLPGGMWAPREMQSCFGGFKSKTNILMLDTCHSGSTLNKLNLPNFVLYATTGSRSTGWVDRKFSNCANYIECKINKSLDKSGDGIVDYQEAFNEAKRLAAVYDPWLRNYCKNQYKPPRPPPPGALASMSLVPVIIPGKQYVKANLGPLKSGTAKKKRRGRDPGKSSFEKAEKYEGDGKFDKALSYYAKVAGYGDRTDYAEDAAKKIEEILADEEKSAKIKDSYKARALVAAAEAYFEYGNKEKAKALCEKVISDYPDTKSVKTAKRLLKKLG